MAVLNKDIRVSDADLLRANMVIEAFREPAMLLDNSFCITAWNIMCEAMCGKPATHALGRPFYALFPDAADNPKLITALQQARNGYASFLAAKDCQYTEGSFDNHFMPLKNNEGTVVGVMHTRHDVAHRLKAMTALEEANKKLLQSNADLMQMTNTLQTACKSIRSFLYEPVTKIYNFAQMLLDYENAGLNACRRNYLERLRKLAGKSRGFTTKLIDYVLLDEVNDAFASIDLNQIFLLIRNKLQQEINAAGAVLEWEQLPVIMGDRRLVYLMFSELVANALNYGKNGIPLRISVTGGKTSVELLAEDRPAIASFVWVKVADNGLGFDGEQAVNIFRPFYKAPRHLRTAGYGIGLAMCMKIADRHKGLITAHTTESGSAFTCSFPDHTY